MAKDKVLLVDTNPRNAHKHGINLGYEIVRKRLNAETCHFKQTPPNNIKSYEMIGFNVTYPMHVLNIAPFLKAHSIPPLRSERSDTLPSVVIGGQGATNLSGALDAIGDVFLGELDGDVIDKRGWRRKSVIDTPPVLSNKRAVLELARGCKHRCGFCELAWVHGGWYREREIGLVKEQLDLCLQHTGQITVLAPNLASYSDLEELAEFCQARVWKMHCASISLKSEKDFMRILNVIEQLGISRVHLGVESFDEATRTRIRKGITDEFLDFAFDELLKRCAYLHVMLICGIPGDAYSQWLEWVKRIAVKRNKIERTVSPVRVDFQMTNFLPVRGTPLENFAEVGFAEKHEFLHEWVKVMKKVGFYNPRRNKPIWYGSDYGKHGCKELSYKMLMEIKHGGPDITRKLVDVFPKGIGRSISDAQARRFLEYR